MGIIEIQSLNTLVLSSHIITYGNAAEEAVTEQIREEIDILWNEPRATVLLQGGSYSILFNITAAHRPDITQEEIMSNDNPLNNYFRIEEFAHGNISFVDGLGC